MSRSTKQLRALVTPRTLIRKRNAKWRETEYARTYHSRERVRWVKSLGCCFCTAASPLLGWATVELRSVDNAHTVNDGKGRKGHYSTIVPLCRSHHRCYDEHRKPFNDPALRRALRDEIAASVERRWQSYLNKRASA